MLVDPGLDIVLVWVIGRAAKYVQPTLSPALIIHNGRQNIGSAITVNDSRRCLVLPP
jgi:hypothetical protein